MSKTKFSLKWKHILANPSLRIEFILTFLILITTVYCFSRYLVFNETRPGAVIEDPILKYFDPINLNPLIFFSIYSSLIVGLISFSFDPRLLMTAFQTYILMVFFRMLAMYLVPLDPPVGCIDLQDPVVFLLGTGKKIIKDLFFSGHTSTAFMLFLVSKNRYLKFCFLFATIIVGISVILQKAHYTIDVFVGLIFAYASYQIVKNLHRKYKLD